MSNTKKIELPPHTHTKAENLQEKMFTERKLSDLPPGKCVEIGEACLTTWAEFSEVSHTNV